MNPDPNTPKRFEELLKDDSGVVVPPSSADGEQRKLHVLTALLAKYKAVARPPAAAAQPSADYNAKIERVMALTKNIRPKAPASRDFLAPLRIFFSLEWARPAVLVPVAVCALLVAGLSIYFIAGGSLQARHTLLVLNTIPSDTVVRQFVTRGGATSQVRSSDLTAAVVDVVSRGLASGFVPSRHATGQAKLQDADSSYPNSLLGDVHERFAIVIAQVQTTEGARLELRLYDTQKKALVIARKIEASDADELRDEIAVAAKFMMGKVAPGK